MNKMRAGDARSLNKLNTLYHVTSVGYRNNHAKFQTNPFGSFRVYKEQTNTHKVFALLLSSGAPNPPNPPPRSKKLIKIFVYPLITFLCQNFKLNGIG